MTGEPSTNTMTSTINNSTFTHNNAEDGGAIYNSGSLNEDNSTYNNNIANDDGGAIYNNYELTITNTTFTDNTANNNGGAIENYDSDTVTLTNNTFTGNYAVNGGAIDDENDWG